MSFAFQASFELSSGHSRTRSMSHSDAELLLFELEAKRAYGARIGADQSLEERSARARRNADKTPLTSTKPW
ncbi:hypothetical protein IEZ26_04565 [Nocardioides cavernae]|uniref:Uncharacterized protein n=1 Tax=Nocardioides cavernae TaxID=1921566 RepID=A0ABR8N6V9_9ACTN|nr:hypothetical protein [Nocardioides cavernae]MBD3923885.1 hypothetical protein [Nocardioides cavernae]MBM7511179.1 hypothetical protein [Nocardioides cavernae]